MVYIRFPNNGKKLSQCKYGKVLYLFTDGDLAICPYMVFACANPDSKYKKSDFIFQSIFTTFFTRIIFYLMDIYSNHIRLNSYHLQ